MLYHWYIFCGTSYTTKYTLLHKMYTIYILHIELLRGHGGRINYSVGGCVVYNTSTATLSLSQETDGINN